MNGAVAAKSFAETVHNTHAFLYSVSRANMAPRHYFIGFEHF